MDFRTKIENNKSSVEISHQSNLMLFGSCFAQNIGLELYDNKFKVITNPFGILYNPSSISSTIRRLLSQNTFNENELTYLNGLYHSFMHHGDFSSINKEKCLNNINRLFEESASALTSTDIFLFTFGTAYIYKLNETNEVVANCHKFPASHFIRSRMSVEEIIYDWVDIIDQLLNINKDAKFIFTVSPIRHWKDGFHGNTISKSILHLAIEGLLEKYPESIVYFPAYEIIIDDLRDYRFYTEDMIHPSPKAIKYIWKLFGETFFSKNTNDIINQWIKIKKSIDHKPINKETENYSLFLKQCLVILNNFIKSYPYINCDKELETLTCLIKE